jgi:hypothetical protein
MATSEEFFVRRIVLLWSSVEPRIMCTPFSASRAHKHVAKTVELLIRDIKNQAEHHRKVTFQEEFRLFLRRYEISIDERYVWD